MVQMELDQHVGSFIVKETSLSSIRELSLIDHMYELKMENLAAVNGSFQTCTF